MAKKLKVKKDKNNKDVTMEFKQGEKKGDFLRRLIKKYAGDNAELPKVF
jgi:hypothetical protein